MNIARVIIMSIVLSLSCDYGTSPDDIELHIQNYWNAAMVCLVEHERLDEKNMRVLTPAYFSWQSNPGPFECDGELANGCFNVPKRLITYNAHTPQVIIHESAHAILWYFKDENWREHRCD